MIPVDIMKSLLIKKPVNTKIYEDCYWLEYPDLIFIVYPERINILEFTTYSNMSDIQKDIVKITDIDYLNLLLYEYDNIWKPH